MLEAGSEWNRIAEINKHLRPFLLTNQKYKVFRRISFRIRSCDTKTTFDEDSLKSRQIKNQAYR